MPPRSPAEDRDAARWAEAQEHGGLVALEGGPAAGRWYFKDWWLGQPESCWMRAGYVETSGRLVNPVPDLRGYGTGVVWRFDPTLVPAVEVAAAPVPRPAGWCAKCAQGPAGEGGVLCPGCWVRIEGRRGESRAA